MYTQNKIIRHELPRFLNLPVTTLLIYPLTIVFLLKVPYVTDNLVKTQ